MAIDPKRLKRDAEELKNDLFGGSPNSKDRKALENKGWTEAQIDAKFDGSTDIVEGLNGEPLTAKEAAAQKAEAERPRLKDSALTKFQENNDWRFKIHMPENSNHLYKAEEPGVLTPLALTKGIVFPYTPKISVQYTADYSSHALTHSNLKSYFYKGSRVENLIISGTFTAQDNQEANYLLAVMHFFRAATKMFYGNDTERGTPPPVLLVSGFGEYQFNEHPCVMSLFSYNLPDDVDYIAAGPQLAGVTPSFIQNQTGAESFGSRGRLQKSSLKKGGFPAPFDPPLDSDIYQKSTYVPTKIDFQLTLLPINSRDQMANGTSKEDEGFSFAKYASGELIKKGYW